MKYWARPIKFDIVKYNCLLTKSIASIFLTTNFHIAEERSFKKTKIPKPLSENQMAKTLFFFSFSLLTFFLSLSSANPNPTNSNTTTTVTSAHNELNKYGFPIGLLPKSVTSYSINHTSGEFSVEFGDSCKITLPPDNYLATYSKKITGKIVENRIADIDGISVRAFFKWWSITGIRLSGDSLVFEVGMVTAKYPSKNFDVILECEGRRHSDS